MFSIWWIRCKSKDVCVILLCSYFRRCDICKWSCLLLPFSLFFCPFPWVQWNFWILWVYISLSLQHIPGSISHLFAYILQLKSMNFLCREWIMKLRHFWWEHVWALLILTLEIRLNMGYKWTNSIRGFCFKPLFPFYSCYFHSTTVDFPHVTLCYLCQLESDQHLILLSVCVTLSGIGALMWYLQC